MRAASRSNFTWVWSVIAKPCVHRGTKRSVSNDRSFSIKQFFSHRVRNFALQTQFTSLYHAHTHSRTPIGVSLRNAVEKLDSLSPILSSSTQFSALSGLRLFSYGFRIIARMITKNIFTVADRYDDRIRKRSRWLIGISSNSILRFITFANSFFTQHWPCTGVVSSSRYTNGFVLRRVYVFSVIYLFLLVNAQFSDFLQFFLCNREIQLLQINQLLIM